MHKICFTISLFHASTCFEQHVLIVRRSKLYFTASGITTPIDGRPVYTCAHCEEVKIVLYSLWYHHTYRWPSRAHLGTGRPIIGMMIPEAV